MAENSKIQWTDHTWNIARGCTKVDEDCKFCYMYRGSYEGTRYDPYKVIKTKSVFNLPLKIKEPSKFFVSSLTDVFHPAIDEFREEMWDIIRKCPYHIFQILTKRPERIIECLPRDWGYAYKNVWLGTSIGHKKAMHRFKELIEVPAHIRFISFEPLWERILVNTTSIDMNYIDWVIIGGESGNEKGKYRYRPCKVEWITDLIYAFYPFSSVFVKQLGTHLSKELGLKDRHGGNIDEWPEELQIRQFPQTLNIKS